MTARHALLLAHRWTGLVLAAFLVLAGATGAFLAFHHEIDAALTPELHRVTPGPARASLDGIAAAIEARHPHLAVGYFLLNPDPRGAVVAVMNTRAAAEAGKLDRDAARPTHVYSDPYTGRLLGERTWGELGGSRAHLVPMVYRLHMSLFLGETGQWITGGVAAALLLLVIVGVVLAVPRLHALRTSFHLRMRPFGPRAWFDLHRTVGVAGGVVLLVLAFTGFYMNLPAVIEPVVAAASPFSPRPPSVRMPGAPREWKVGWDAALAAARAEQPEHPAVVFGRVESRGYYQVRFMPPGDIVDAGTIRLFVDGREPRVLGRFEDRKGSAGDVIRVWQFPLHSGQGFGLPGRIVVAVSGVMPIVLAATGVALWWRRRRRREALAR